MIEARPGWKILECFSGDTEVLTERGWQRLDSLDKSLKVAQYDTGSREITFEKPLQYIHHKDRETFSYEDRHTSLCATANHNMLTVWGKDYEVAKHKFKDVRFSRGNAFINAGFYNNGASNEFQSRYIAMFTADGSKTKDGYVTFCFSKERKVERCKYILNTLGIEYSFSKIIRSNGVVNYNFYLGKRTNHLLKGFVDRDKKLTMNCIHNLDIKAFLDEVQYWDATYTVARGKQTVRFTTCVKETAEIVQLMCNLQGKKSTIRIDDHNKRVTNGKHSRVYYLSYKRHRNDPHTFMSGEVVDFTKPVIQDVYCVTMPKGTVVIRHNRKVSIQGNCDFSQIELRVASMFSGDVNMQHAYKSGSDLHSKTTELLFGDTSSLSHQEQKRKRTQSKACFSGDTEILTEKGFIPFNEYDGVTPVAQVDRETLSMDFTKPLDFRCIPNQEVMEHNDRNVSIKCTLNHRYWLLREKVKSEIGEFKDIKLLGDSKLNWVKGAYLTNRPKLSVDETRFLCMCVSDGHFVENKTIPNAVTFTFRKKRKFDRCLSIINSLNLSYHTNYLADYKYYTVYVHSNEFIDSLFRYTTKDKKLIWDNIHDVDFNTYVEECFYWDGTYSKKKGANFVTTQEQTCDVMQYMFFTIGRKVNKVIQPDNREGRSTLYRLNVPMVRGKSPFCRMLPSKIDVSVKTTEDVYCVQVPKDTIVLRRNGKIVVLPNCNFGFLYGMSAKTFQEYGKGYGLNLTLEDCEHLRDNFFKSYPTLVEWHKNCVNFARANGYTWSPIGRKRFLPDINSSNFRARGQAERQSINSGVQGFASDMCTSALADIVFSDEIDHDRCIVLGSVHDAILFEIRDDYVEEVVPKLKSMMENPSIIEGIDIPIPIIADAEVAQAWGG